MSQPAPANSTSLSALMAQVARRNATLLHYLYPTSDVTTDPNINWVPYLPQCELRTDCYCHHVEGDMSRARNPDGWKKCTYKFDIHRCSPHGAPPPPPTRPPPAAAHTHRRAQARRARA